MRVSEGVVAIYGPTCVGKTTVASGVASAMGWTHRDCGQEVLAVARARGVQAVDLNGKEHEGIDRATRAFAAECEGGAVIDGRYLHYVLAEVGGVVLVELRCCRSIRVDRYRRRTKRGDAGAVVDEADRRDMQFCSKVYAVEPRGPDYVLDTTALTVREAVDTVSRGEYMFIV